MNPAPHMVRRGIEERGGMKLITRDTDYAIRALCYIAKHKKETISAKEMVARLKMPRPFLRKILQVLNNEKILKSHKGKGGGFKLVKEPGDILLLDLMKIFQGPFELNEHIFKNSPCAHKKTCSLKKRLDRIEGHIVSELSDITLKCLL